PGAFFGSASSVGGSCKSVLTALLATCASSFGSEFRGNGFAKPVPRGGLIGWMPGAKLHRPAGLARHWHSLCKVFSDTTSRADDWPRSPAILSGKAGAMSRHKRE